MSERVEQAEVWCSICRGDHYANDCPERRCPQCGFPLSVHHGELKVCPVQPQTALEGAQASDRGKTCRRCGFIVGFNCRCEPIRVAGGGDYCFKHEWSVLEKGPCGECASDEAHMDAQGRLANDPETFSFAQASETNLSECPDCGRTKMVHIEGRQQLCDTCGTTEEQPMYVARVEETYFGRDLAALIDVLNAYADGNGANGCNLNTQEARKIAGILASHVYG